jgi:hypothetical protein
MNNIISKLQHDTDKTGPVLIPKPLKINYSKPMDNMDMDNMDMDHMDMDNMDMDNMDIDIDDNLKKKMIISKIKLINNKCYLNNIFIFIKNNNIKYTLNNNGVFFNLNTLNPEKLDLFYNHINSIITNIDIFDNDDNNLQNIKDNIKITNKKLINTNYSTHISLSLNEFTDFEKKIIKLSNIN